MYLRDIREREKLISRLPLFFLRSNVAAYIEPFKFSGIQRRIKTQK